MSQKTKCGKCGKFGKITWANYIPYCDECLKEKSKRAIPFEEAMFDESDAYRSIQEINERLDKLEEDVKKIKEKIKT